VSAAFIDSNVILYLLSSDSCKADRAESILLKGGIVSVQVLNEVSSVCLRKLKMNWQEIDDLLLAVKAACPIVPLTLESHEKAVLIAKRYRLSFYDSHICASAILSDAKMLLSEDMQNGMMIEDLIVNNPFA
jgi:predicted nucleic acid-binding protein